MCFGVRDAIALATNESGVGPLTVLGELVHNETVLAGLRERGVAVKRALHEVTTTSVMITAHGASGRALAQVRARGLRVLDATCPLVRVAHDAVAELVNEGYHPVIVGQRHHVEVQGLTGDLDSYDVILDEADVLSLVEFPRFGVVAQTTQPVERVEWLVNLVRWRFPGSEVRVIDTVCRPTKQNQRAAVELATVCDVVVVVGGAHSNNTQELVKTCRRHCRRVHHVQCASDVHSEWFDSANTVGLTAGTSTPDDVIEEVERRIEEQGAPQPSITSNSPACLQID
jgi:4-hydroxy-3-methylbut-2-enyl diphosphate reductase